MMAAGSNPTLSEEYRPGVLLSGFPDKDGHTHRLEDNNIHSKKESAKYLSAYAERFIEDIAKLKLQDETLPKDHPKSLLSDYITTRLKKVGAKNFTPKIYRDDEIKEQSKINNFSWEHFKQQQQISLEKLSTQIEEAALNHKIAGKLLSDNTETAEQIRLKQQSKFGVYEGWIWQSSAQDPNIFYLINNNVTPAKKIKVYYKENADQGDCVDITTRKSNMQDDVTVAIMLEIARNVQRYSGSNQQIKTIGLDNKTTEEQQILGKIDQGIGFLNEGVKQAKSITDQNKKITRH
jgi:hypothetical protein